MKRFEKSIAPRPSPITGMKTSLTSDVTILPNAAPMITAIARSSTFPRRMNFLNSANMFALLSRSVYLVTIFGMAKPALITVTCPCCQAELHIDPATSAVIRHKAHEKPATFSDMEAAVSRFKTEAGRREDAFEKSVAEHKVHHDVLSKKFDEMLKLAKENPDEPPPKRDIDFD